MHRQLNSADSLSPGVKLPKNGNRPLRLMMIVESSGGGTGRHVLDLCQGFIERGCDVHLVYSTARIDQMFSERLAEIKGLHAMAIDVGSAPTPRDWLAIVEIRRYLRANGPFDAVHGHSSKGGALARMAVIGTEARAYYTLHGLIMMDPGLHPFKRLFYRGVEQLLALRTHRIIAVSPEEARAAIAVGLGRSRVALVPNGLGDLRLTPRTTARQTMGVCDQNIVIGFIGRLVSQKAPHVLLNAFALAHEKQPQCRLAIVGAGPLDRPMRDLAAELKISDKVIWLGERDARTVLAGFDLFALSSRKEGLPYVVLEAMATGLPVVATESSGVEILIKTGSNGVVVPRDDVQAFGNALATIATDPNLMMAMATASKIRSQAFTIDAMVDATLALYSN